MSVNNKKDLPQIANARNVQADNPQSPINIFFLLNYEFLFFFFMLPVSPILKTLLLSTWEAHQHLVFHVTQNGKILHRFDKMFGVHVEALKW